MKNRIREGYSLIELIIVIAIMAIVIGGVALTTALLRSADTQGLANAINNSLTDLKTYSESRRGPIYLYIYKSKGDGDYYAHYGFPDADGNPKDKPEEFTVPTNPGDDDEKLGSSVLTVKYEGHEISGNNFCTIQIQKKDGAYVTVSSGPYTQPTPKSFEIYNGSQPNYYKVILAKETGLHYVELAEVAPAE